MDFHDVDRSSSLIELDISRNKLDSIDVTSLPNLRTLNLDNNNIARIRGLHSLNGLKSLSWRNQLLRDGLPEQEIQYNSCNEISKLLLSGNKFHEFVPRVSFLNLQRLELASVGLRALSSDFGLQMPNLRVLNVNNNTLKDLRPLLGISKLTELHVAGNRIFRLRRTAAVLSVLGKSLTVFDCRMNPLTLGFYPTYSRNEHMEKVLVLKERLGGCGDEQEVEDTMEVTANSYILPTGKGNADDAHRQRLDEGTSLRRRVYELLVLGGCKLLIHLDGLPVDRREVANKDGVWNRLLELGVLKEHRVKTKRASREESQQENGSD